MKRPVSHSAQEKSPNNEIRRRIEEIKSGKVVIDWPKFRSLGSLDLFIALMSKGDYGIVSEAAREVAGFGTRAEEPLLGLLGEPDRGNGCHVEAVRCLRRVGTVRAIPKLYELLGNRSRSKQRAAIASLAAIWKRCGQAPDIEILIRMFRTNEDFIVRDTALEVLVSTGAPEAFTAVRALIRKAHSLRTLPGSVIRAYGSLGGVAVIDELEAMLRDSNYLKVMELCRKEVAKVAGNNISVDIVRKRFDYDGWKNVRRAVVEALAEIGGPRVMPILLSVVAYDPIDVVRERAEEMIRTMLLAEGKDPAQVKLEACPLVPKPRNERHVPPTITGTEPENIQSSKTRSADYKVDLPASTEARVELAANMDTPAVVLEALLGDSPKDTVKLAVAGNPNIDSIVLRKLLAQGDDRIKVKLVHALTCADSAVDPEEEDRITAWLLEILTGAGEPVAAAIARSRYVPIPVLRALASYDEGIRISLARRDDLPQDMLEDLYKSGTAGIRRTLILNRNLHLPESEYAAILESARGEERNDWQVRAALAGKANLDAELIRKLASDDVIRVRAALARRNDLPREVMELLGADPLAYVRAQLMENPATPIHLLRNLIEDDTPLSKGLWNPVNGAAEGFLYRDVQILERRGERVRDRLLMGPGILRSPAARILMPFLIDEESVVNGSMSGEVPVVLRILNRDIFTAHVERIKDGSLFIDFGEPRGLADPVNKEITVYRDHPAHIDTNGVEDVVGLFRTIIRLKTNMLVFTRWPVLEEVAADLSGRTYEQDLILRHFFELFFQEERECINADDRKRLEIDPLWNRNRSRGKQGPKGSERRISFPRIISELLAIIHEYRMLALLSKRLEHLQSDLPKLLPKQPDAVAVIAERVSTLSSDSKNVIASTMRAREDLHLIDQRITGNCIFEERDFSEPIFMGKLDGALLPLP